MAAFSSAAALGRFVSVGHLNLEEIEQSLIAAACQTGLTFREASQQVKSGLRRGAENPATDLSSRDDALKSQVRPIDKRAQEPVLSRVPDSSSVSELWSSAVPVAEDEQVAKWCRSRALDPNDIADWNLARAIPGDARLPRWAYTKHGGAWARSGHRLLVPLYDATGTLASFRARAVAGDGEPAKSLAPTGFQTKGLIFACPLTRQVLAGAAPDWWAERSFVISEGEVDWLSWASRHSQEHQGGPAYLGITAGSWTPEIAARIPSGSHVCIRTDPDQAGCKYAAKIARGLHDRCIVRVPVPEEIV